MENLQEQIQQAKALERAQKNDAALDVFLRLAAESGPHLEEASFWLHLGDLGRRTQRVDVAADAYPRAVEILERGAHPNSALAVARRLARTTPDDPAAHLKVGQLAVGLGYAGEARDGYLEAAERQDGTTPDGEVLEGLRTVWGLLRNAGRAQDAESVRARILEISPDADPLDDETLEAAAPSPDLADLAGSAPDAEPGDASATPGLQPTVITADDGAPAVERMEGLEPTSAGTGTAATEPDDPAGEGLTTDSSDLPLLSTTPDFPGRPETGEDDEVDESEHIAEPLPGLLSSMEDEDLSDDDQDSIDAAGLPLLRSLPEPASSAAAEEPDREERGAPDVAARSSDAERMGLEQTSDDDADLEESVVEDEPEPVPPAASLPVSPSRAEQEGDYVDLGALILNDDEEEEGTRFQMDAADHPSGDEDKDFAHILGTFRQHISDKIDASDSTSHYDLGLAFKDMGLLDDAIGQFQRALRAGANPVATIEVLGECFIEKGEHALAVRVLQRGSRLKDVSEADLVGILYWLGRSQEELASMEEARGNYERVVAVDIKFRDAATRLQALRGDSRPDAAT